VILSAGGAVACERESTLAGARGATLSTPAAANVTATSQRTRARFDGERALRHLEELVERGHRQVGGPSRAEAVAALESDLAAVADRVERQELGASVGALGDVELLNLLARWRPGAQSRVLLATHWDTRLHADRDPDPSRRKLPVPGANDGGSGVVVLIELLRILQSGAVALDRLGVDVALFDGEELVVEGEPPCCPGARHFASTLSSSYPAKPPVAAIVIDMVGDRELTFEREARSDLKARWLVDLVWSVGRRHAPAVFLDVVRSPVRDDHVALQQAGVPAVLMIDLDYEAWHTTSDTADRVSAESLAITGEVLLDVLAELARRDRSGSDS
jgi:hypothetical protein